MNEHYIFVYGTLRKEGAYHWLLVYCQATNQAEYIGKGKIKGDLVVDKGFLPFAIEEGTLNIIGEVYKVSDEGLALINELETEYVGKKVNVQMAYGNIIKALVYFWKKPLPRKTVVVTSGDYISWVEQQIERIK